MTHQRIQQKQHYKKTASGALRKGPFALDAAPSAYPV